MPGEGVTDNMIKSYRTNRRVLKGSRKRLKKIYEENNYFYIQKKVRAKTQDYDEEQKRIFLKKFYSKQRKARQRQAFLLVILIALFSSLFYLIY